MTEEELHRIAAWADVLAGRVAKAKLHERLYADYIAEPIWKALNGLYWIDARIRNVLSRRTKRIARKAIAAQYKARAAHRAREAVKALVR